jgi:hypothetical protein
MTATECTYDHSPDRPDDCPCGQIPGAARPDPGQVPVTITLPAADWRAIARALREDADCEDLGENEASLPYSAERDDDDPDWLDARAADAAATCHANGAATERCAASIEAQLGGLPVHAVPGLAPQWLVEEITQELSGAEGIARRFLVAAVGEREAFTAAQAQAEARDGRGFLFAPGELEELEPGYRWAASDGSSICYEVRQITSVGGEG